MICRFSFLQMQLIMVLGVFRLVPYLKKENVKFDGRDISSIVEYFSRKLTDCEQIYAITEKEVMAIVEVLEFFTPYVLGYLVCCHTDERAIVWLLQKSYPSRFFRYQTRAAHLAWKSHISQEAQI